MRLDGRQKEEKERALFRADEIISLKKEIFGEGQANIDATGRVERL